MKRQREKNVEFLQDFGNFIRDGRNRRELLQRQVAEPLGVSQEYYSMIERGIREVDFEMAIKICSILGLDINKFINEHI